MEKKSKHWKHKIPGDGLLSNVEDQSVSKTSKENFSDLKRKIKNSVSWEG